MSYWNNNSRNCNPCCQTSCCQPQQCNPVCYQPAQCNPVCFQQPIQCVPQCLPQCVPCCVKGQKGDPGQKGEPGTGGGEKGQKGEVGEKGQKGEVGTPGEKGQKGEVGTPGEKGQKGEVGEKGQKGDIGEKGEKGEKGDCCKGEKGEKGDKGEKGEKGEKGALGDKGEKGAIGEKGATGDIVPIIQYKYTAFIPPGALLSNSGNLLTYSGTSVEPFTATPCITVEPEPFFGFSLLRLGADCDGLYQFKFKAFLDITPSSGNFYLEMSLRIGGVGPFSPIDATIFRALPAPGKVPADFGLGVSQTYFFVKPDDGFFYDIIFTLYFFPDSADPSTQIINGQIEVSYFPTYP